MERDPANRRVHFAVTIQTDPSHPSHPYSETFTGNIDTKMRGFSVLWGNVLILGSCKPAQGR